MPGSAHTIYLVAKHIQHAFHGDNIRDGQLSNVSKYSIYLVSMRDPSLTMTIPSRATAIKARTLHRLLWNLTSFSFKISNYCRNNVDTDPMANPI